MLNFNFHNPTKILFGKNKIHQLGKEILPYGRKVLLVYGGGSIKKNGIYDQVIEELNKSKIDYTELSGIAPNPRIKSVREGVKICKADQIDLVLAVGGGSVIDASKLIAAGAKYTGDSWDFMINQAKIAEALPLGCVLTLSATGSEMNGNAVITNWDTQEKLAVTSDKIYPKFSILDPTYTYTVPNNQTAYGSVDIISHVFEQYFSKTPSTPIQNGFSETLLKTVIKFTPIALENPEDYDARANLMLANTLALNGLIGMGKEEDWATHMIEHELSAVYDIPHGAGLAIIFPNWMKYVMEQDLTVFKRFAFQVWDVNPINKADIAAESIKRTQSFFRNIGAPTTLSDVNIKEDRLKEIAEKTIQHMGGPLGSFKKLEMEDVYNILKMSL